MHLLHFLSLQTLMNAQLVPTRVTRRVQTQRGHSVVHVMMGMMSYLMEPVKVGKNITFILDFNRQNISTLYNAVSLLYNIKVM